MIFFYPDIDTYQTIIQFYFSGLQLVLMRVNKA